MKENLLVSLLIQVGKESILVFLIFLLNINITSVSSFSRDMCLSPCGLLSQNHHRLGGLNHKRLCLTSLETWRCKINSLADPMAGEDTLFHR